jgi:hypothetical protein
VGYLDWPIFGRFVVQGRATVTVPRAYNCKSAYYVSAYHPEVVQKFRHKPNSGIAFPVVRLAYTDVKPRVR